MIQDFIDSNCLDAKIFKFPSDVSITKALSAAKLNISSYAKASAFVNDKMDFFVVISIANEKVTIADAEELFNKNLDEIDEGEVLKLTGFEKDYFPPISVFGAKVSFTKEVKKQDKLLFELSPREYLVIEVSSIIKGQELSDYFFEEK